MTNTQRTLKYLKDRGFKYAVVERFIHFGKHGCRKDMFGFADIVAVKGKDIYAIQSCGTSKSAHLKKIINNPYASSWLEAGGRILLISWRKKNPKSMRSRRTYTVEEITKDGRVINYDRPTET